MGQLFIAPCASAGSIYRTPDGIQDKAAKKISKKILK